MKTVKTFQATIFVGFKERYDGSEHSILEAEQICQMYCDDVGLCVSITPTRYIYTKGNEDGCSISLINYPRFPSSQEDILRKALYLANMLMLEFNQYRVTVVASDETYMLEMQ